MVAGRDNDCSNLDIHHHGQRKIDIPVKLSEQVLKFVEEQWEKLQRLLVNNPNITHGACLKALLPAIWAVYDSLQKQYPKPLDFEVALYPYELVTYGETGQVCQNWMQYRLIKKYLEVLSS